MHSSISLNPTDYNFKLSIVRSVNKEYVSLINDLAFVII